MRIIKAVTLHTPADTVCFGQPSASASKMRELVTIERNDSVVHQYLGVFKKLIGNTARFQ